MTFINMITRLIHKIYTALRHQLTGLVPVLASVTRTVIGWAGSVLAPVAARVPHGVRRRTSRQGVFAFAATGVLLAATLSRALAGAPVQAAEAQTSQAAVVPPPPAASAPADCEPVAPQVPAGFTDEQVANAKAITEVAGSRGLNEHAVTIALATAMQESQLKNLDYGDRDSLGLFQQRPSQGWGTPEQIQDPHYSAGKFYDGLVQVPGWENMPVTQAAQTVQRSAFPEAYAKWEPKANDLAHALVSAAKATQDNCDK